MTRLVKAALTVAAVLAVTGCGDSDPANGPANPDPSPGGYFRTVTVNVDGRQVPCVTWKQGYAGGISCDWGAK